MRASTSRSATQPSTTRRCVLADPDTHAARDGVGRLDGHLEPGVPTRVDGRTPPPPQPPQQNTKKKPTQKTQTTTQQKKQEKQKKKTRKKTNTQPPPPPPPPPDYHHPPPTTTPLRCFFNTLPTHTHLFYPPPPPPPTPPTPKREDFGATEWHVRRVRRRVGRSDVHGARALACCCDVEAQSSTAASPRARDEHGQLHHDVSWPGSDFAVDGEQMETLLIGDSARRQSPRFGSDDSSLRCDAHP